MAGKYNFDDFKGLARTGPAETQTAVQPQSIYELLEAIGNEASPQQEPVPKWGLLKALKAGVGNLFTGEADVKYMHADVAEDKGNIEEADRLRAQAIKLQNRGDAITPEYQPPESFPGRVMHDVATSTPYSGASMAVNLTGRGIGGAIGGALGGILGAGAGGVGAIPGAAAGAAIGTNILGGLAALYTANKESRREQAEAYNILTQKGYKPEEAYKESLGAYRVSMAVTAPLDFITGGIASGGAIQKAVTKKLATPLAKLGITPGKGILGGLLAGSEATTAKVGGDLARKTVGQRIKDTLKVAGKVGAGEVFEEASQTAGVQWAAKEPFDAGEIAYSGLVGGLSGALTGGLTHSLTRQNAPKQQVDIKDAYKKAPDGTQAHAQDTQTNTAATPNVDTQKDVTVQRSAELGQKIEESIQIAGRAIEHYTKLGETAKADDVKATLSILTQANDIIAKNSEADITQAALNNNYRDAANVLVTMGATANAMNDYVAFWNKQNVARTLAATPGTPGAAGQQLPNATQPGAEAQGQMQATEQTNSDLTKINKNAEIAAQVDELKRQIKWLGNPNSKFYQQSFLSKTGMKARTSLIKRIEALKAKPETESRNASIQELTDKLKQYDGKGTPETADKKIKELKKEIAKLQNTKKQGKANATATPAPTVPATLPATETLTEDLTEAPAGTTPEGLPVTPPETAIKEKPVTKTKRQKGNAKQEDVPAAQPLQGAPATQLEGTAEQAAATQAEPAPKAAEAVQQIEKVADIIDSPESLDKHVDKLRSAYAHLDSLESRTSAEETIRRKMNDALEKYDKGDKEGAVSALMTVHEETSDIETVERKHHLSKEIAGLDAKIQENAKAIKEHKLSKAAQEILNIRQVIAGHNNAADIQAKRDRLAEIRAAGKVVGRLSNEQLTDISRLESEIRAHESNRHQMQRKEYLRKLEKDNPDAVTAINEQEKLNTTKDDLLAEHKKLTDKHGSTYTVDHLKKGRQTTSAPFTIPAVPEHVDPVTAPVKTFRSLETMSEDNTHSLKADFLSNFGKYAKEVLGERGIMPLLREADASEATIERVGASYDAVLRGAYESTGDRLRLANKFEEFAASEKLSADSKEAFARMAHVLKSPEFKAAFDAATSTDSFLHERQLVVGEDGKVRLLSEANRMDAIRREHEGQAEKTPGEYVAAQKAEKAAKSRHDAARNQTLSDITDHKTRFNILDSQKKAMADAAERLDVKDEMFGLSKEEKRFREAIKTFLSRTSDFTATEQEIKNAKDTIERLDKQGRAFQLNESETKAYQKAQELLDRLKNASPTEEQKHKAAGQFPNYIAYNQFGLLAKGYTHMNQQILEALSMTDKQILEKVKGDKGAFGETIGKLTTPAAQLKRIRQIQADFVMANQHLVSESETGEAIRWSRLLGEEATADQERNAKRLTDLKKNAWLDMKIQHNKFMPQTETDLANMARSIKEIADAKLKRIQALTAMQRLGLDDSDGQGLTKEKKQADAAVAAYKQLTDTVEGMANENDKNTLYKRFAQRHGFDTRWIMPEDNWVMQRGPFEPRDVHDYVAQNVKLDVGSEGLKLVGMKNFDFVSDLLTADVQDILTRLDNETSRADASVREDAKAYFNELQKAIDKSIKDPDHGKAVVDFFEGHNKTNTNYDFGWNTPSFADAELVASHGEGLQPGVGTGDVGTSAVGTGGGEPKTAPQSTQIPTTRVLQLPIDSASRSQFDVDSNARYRGSRPVEGQETTKAPVTPAKEEVSAKPKADKHTGVMPNDDGVVVLTKDYFSTPENVEKFKTALEDIITRSKKAIDATAKAEDRRKLNTHAQNAQQLLNLLNDSSNAGNEFAVAKKKLAGMRSLMGNYTVEGINYQKKGASPLNAQNVPQTAKANISTNTDTDSPVFTLTKESVSKLFGNKAKVTEQGGVFAVRLPAGHTIQISSDGYLTLPNSIIERTWGKWAVKAIAEGDARLSGLFEKGTNNVSIIKLLDAHATNFTANHELMHAAVELALGHQQWKTLKDMYAKGMDNAKASEIIANKFAEFREGRLEAKGPIQRIFQRVSDFFSTLRSMVTGKQTAKDIFRDVESGKVWERGAGGVDVADQSASVQSTKQAKRDKPGIETVEERKQRPTLGSTIRSLYKDGENKKIVSNITERLANEWTDDMTYLKRLGENVHESYERSVFGIEGKIDRMIMHGAPEHDVRSLIEGTKNILESDAPEFDNLLTYMRLEDTAAQRSNLKERAALYEALAKAENANARLLKQDVTQKDGVFEGSEVGRNTRSAEASSKMAAEYKQFAKELRKRAASRQTTVHADEYRANINRILDAHPEWAEYAKIVQGFARHQLERARDAGLISREMFDRMVEANPHYVPIMRNVEQGLGLDSYMRRIESGVFDMPDLTKKYKGGQEHFISPVEQIVIHENQLQKAIAKQRVLDTIAANIDNGEMDPTLARKAGKGEKISTAETEFTILNKGKPERYIIQKDIKQLIDNFGSMSGDSNVVAKSFTKMASVVRETVTRSPVFWSFNMLKDSGMAGILNKGFRPVYDSVRALMTYLDRNNSLEAAKTWDDFMKYGGHQAATWATYDMKKTEYRKMYRQAKSGTLNPIETTRKFYNWLGDMRELSEISTRLGIFMRMTELGMSPEEAAYRSVSLLRFRSGGRSAKYISRFVPFFNPAIQGTAVLGRGLFHDGKIDSGTLTRGLFYVTLPSMLAAMWNLSDDDRKDIYDDLPDWDKNSSWCFVVGDTVMRFPKPHTAGVVLGSVPERFVDYMVAKDKRALRGLGGAIVDSVAPASAMPLAFQIPMEITANYSMFSGRPIVPASELRYSPRHRYGAYTSKTAKFMSDIIYGSTNPFLEAVGSSGVEVSPRVIEHIVKGTLTNMGKEFMNISDHAIQMLSGTDMPSRPLYEHIPVTSRFVSDGTRMSASEQHFRTDMNDLLEQLNTAKLISERTPKSQMRQKDIVLLGAQESIRRVQSRELKAVTELQKEITDITKDPRMSGERKKQLIEARRKKITALSRAGLQKIDRITERL